MTVGQLATAKIGSSLIKVFSLLKLLWNCLFQATTVCSQVVSGAAIVANCGMKIM